MQACTHKCESMCSCCPCCQPTFKPQRCPKHLKQRIKYLCSHPRCHQLLCNDCLSIHKTQHRQKSIGQLKLTPVSDLSRIYTKQNISDQLQQIKQRKKHSYQKPQQLIKSYIDQALYGTTQHREKQLQTNLKLMKQKYSTKLLIKFVQDDNQYSIKDNKYSEFREKYFRFLDGLFADIQEGRYDK